MFWFILLAKLDLLKGLPCHLEVYRLYLSFCKSHLRKDMNNRTEMHDIKLLCCTVNVGKCCTLFLGLRILMVVVILVSTTMIDAD